MANQHPLWRRIFERILGSTDDPNLDMPSRRDVLDGVGVAGKTWAEQPTVVDMTGYRDPAAVEAARLFAGGRDVDAFLDGMLAAREERRLDEADALAADIDLPTLTAYENGDTVVMPIPVHLPAARDGWEVTHWTLKIDPNPETGGAHFYGTVCRAGDQWIAGDYSTSVHELGRFDHLVDAMEAVEAAATRTESPRRPLRCRHEFVDEEDFCLFCGERYTEADDREVEYVDDGLGDEMEADLARGIGDDD